MPAKILIGVVAVAGGAALLWLFGHLGFRLGFASVLGLPGLLSEPMDGLTGAMLMFANMPSVVIAGGLAEPIWLLVAFVLLCVPAGALAAVRPLSPGGPRLSPFVAFMCNVGATSAMISAAIAGAWLLSPLRGDRFAALPEQQATFDFWLTDMKVAATFDLAAMVMMTLWIVLLFRLPLAFWLRSLSLTVAMAIGAIVLILAASSHGALAHSGQNRCVVLVNDEPQLLLGSTRSHLATLRVEGRGDGQPEVRIDLISPDVSLPILERKSLTKFIKDADP